MMNRRVFQRTVLSGLALAPLTLLLREGKDSGKSVFWQIDPTKCIQCDRCETDCVLDRSAVKAVHQFAACGYCLFCSGYYQDKRAEFDTAGENLRCPTDAIARTYIEDPYFEYVIDEEKCNGCGKCVKGCSSFGNGSLFLQVKQDLCRNCNQCRIAARCPSGAFVRVSPDRPYLYKISAEAKPESEAAS